MTPFATKDRVRLRSRGWLGTVACVKPTHFDSHVYVTWDRKVDDVDGPYELDELDRAAALPDVEQVAEHRRRTQSLIVEAREACTLAVADATCPEAGRALMGLTAGLADLLLDDWQLTIATDLIEHHTGAHGPDCTSGLCDIDPDELVELADRWEQRWPVGAAWLRELAEVPPCSTTDQRRTP